MPRVVSLRVQPPRSRPLKVLRPTTFFVCQSMIVSLHAYAERLPPVGQKPTFWFCQRVRTTVPGSTTTTLPRTTRLAESGKQDGKKGLSPMTIHHVHACPHKSCKDAVRWGQLTRNPLEAADPPRAKGDGSKEMKTWSGKQLRAFLGSVREDRLHSLWHTLAMTGMRRGEALLPEVISGWFRQAVKKAMLPQIRLHDLRHTPATLAPQAGIHRKVVSERLGHATVSITFDTYSHAIPAMQEEAAALIVGLVFAGE